MAVVAKVVCNSKLLTGGGDQRLALIEFSANVTPENAEWAKYTPQLQLSIVVNGPAAERFEPGESYLLTFEPSK